MIWYILLGILVVLLVLLLTPVRCHVLWQTEAPAQVSLHWLFLRFQIAPRKPGKATRPKEKKPPKKRPKRPDTTADTPEAFSEKMAALLAVLRSTPDMLGRLARRFRFYKIRLDMTVVRDDAAATAIAFGKMNAAVYSIYATAKNLLNMAEPEIAVRPDFTAEKGSARLEMRGRLSPLAMLTVLLPLLSAFMAPDTPEKTPKNKKTS